MAEGDVHYSPYKRDFITLNKAVIPLQAKRVVEFIEIRHKKNSPTRILRTLRCL